MRSSLVLSAVLTMGLLAGVSPTNAQSPTSAPAEAENDAGQQAQQTVPGQNGKEEPGSHASVGSAPDSNAVFLNGALNVPGAPPNTDTVPAKFSTKNAADDKLITTAYTLKILPQDQRTALYRGLKDQQPVVVFRADVGTELPASTELRAIPTELAKRVPLVEGYQYAVTDQRVMVVSPATRIVVGVLFDDTAATIGAGQGAR